jgi:hypothetical protein
MLRNFATLALSGWLAIVAPACGFGAQATDDSPVAEKRPAEKSIQWNSNVLTRELALAVGHPLVRDELELLPYQIEQLKQLQYETQNEITKTAREYARLKPDQRDQGLAEVYARTRAEMDRVLLPKQSQRLEQIAVQSLGPVESAEDGMALVNLLLIPTIRSELKVSNEDLEAMYKASQEQNEILKRELAELRARANRAVLSKIDPEIRRQVEQLVGAPFDFGDYQLGRGGVFRKKSDD